MPCPRHGAKHSAGKMHTVSQGPCREPDPAGGGSRAGGTRRHGRRTRARTRVTLEGGQRTSEPAREPVADTGLRCRIGRRDHRHALCLARQMSGRAHCQQDCSGVMRRFPDSSGRGACGPEPDRPGGGGTSQELAALIARNWRERSARFLNVGNPALPSRAGCSWAHSDPSPSVACRVCSTRGPRGRRPASGPRARSAPAPAPRSIEFLGLPPHDGRARRLRKGSHQPRVRAEKCRDRPGVCVARAPRRIAGRIHGRSACRLATPVDREARGAAT